jgi:hypothetical protein
MLKWLGLMETMSESRLAKEIDGADFCGNVKVKRKT